MEHHISEEEWEILVDVLSDVRKETDQEFQQWLSLDPANRQYFEELRKIHALGMDIGVEQRFNIVQMWETINERIDREEKTRIKWYCSVAVKVAASIILPILLLGGGYFVGRMSTKDQRQFATVFASSIEPGSKKAHLILADGTKVDLSSDAMIKEADGTIISNSEKALTYNEDNAKGKPRINTLVVPIGGEYKLILADGTKVWLNSGSTLKYPTSFDKERRIELTGEAYFEVHKDPTKPFRVTSRGLTVTALGTAFNVNAYESSKPINTTLVEGSVSLVSAKGGMVILKPNENGSFDEQSNKYHVEHDVPLDLYVAWKDGYFKFKEQTLDDIADRLGRWYSCQFIFQDNAIKNMKFTGIVERNKPLVYVLSKISSIKDVDYEVKGDVVVLKRKI
jgi:ferric-dicitrate binding protein FerR (iron transport regulator)